jgi:exopolysaccharide production protein ExoZ
MAESKRRNLSLVQLFRVIAVLLILLGHANKVFKSNFQYEWLNLGTWVRTGGVDFFWIVSGFMMYYLYHKSIGVPGKAREFLIKRLIKIYPLVWIFTTAVVLSILMFPQIQGSHQLDPNVVIKSELLIPTDLPVLDITWSLSYLVLFYIMFALFIYKPKVLKPVFLGWIILCILQDLNVLRGLNSFLFSFYNLEIMLGSLIAFISMRYKLRFASLYVSIGIIGMVFVWVNNVTHQFAFRLDYVYCLFSALIMLGISLIDMKKDRKLPKTLTIISDSSYSIYIAQLPVMHVVIILLSKLNIVTMLGPEIAIWIAFALTVAGGCCIYYLIEKPISVFLKNKLSNRSRIPTPKSIPVKCSLLQKGCG